LLAALPPLVGRGCDLGAGWGYLSARLLAPQGQLHLVANRHLPYEAALDAAFGEVVTRAEARGYKVLSARRPRAARGGARRRA
jgi:16S rRNA (guanine1207-N2)-methyltransferase